MLDLLNERIVKGRLQSWDQLNKDLIYSSNKSIEYWSPITDKPFHSSSQYATIKTIRIIKADDITVEIILKKIILLIQFAS